MWNFEDYAQNTALLDEFGNKMTYAELTLEAGALSDSIGKRTLVFCLCENKIGAVIGYAAFINAGIVPVLLSAHLKREFLDSLLDTYKPAYVWCPAEMRDGFDDFMQTYAREDYVLLQTAFDLHHELHPELALLLTTSGSTGSPKFVRQSLTNIKSNTDSIVSYLKLNSSERAVTTLPMNYTYGLSIINTHLMVGATLLLTDKGLMQKEFWSFFKAEQATSFGGVPYTYEMLDRIRFYRMDLPALRCMTQAGGKLTPELHKKFAEYAAENGKQFIVMYGQCEATARMGYLPAEMAIEKCGSMGIAIPGGTFRLIDANGHEITEPDETGELVYEGANVTLGYAECISDLAKGDERGGCLQTGDMARRDGDGYYYITGRKKRFLKIYGNRVNLDEIDRLIKGRFNHLDCASTGVDDHMYIFVTDASQADAVKQFVAETTRLNPAAFKTIVIDNIPKNDAGKVLFSELAQLIT